MLKPCPTSEGLDSVYESLIDESSVPHSSTLEFLWSQVPIFNICQENDTSPALTASSYEPLHFKMYNILMCVGFGTYVIYSYIYIYIYINIHILKFLFYIYIMYEYLNIILCMHVFIFMYVSCVHM